MNKLTISLCVATALATQGCMTPVGIAYTAASTGSLIATGRTAAELTAGQLTDADCSIWDAVVNLAYICEYNRNPARTYNRNPY